MNKIFTAISATALLLLTATSAQAALVNYVITGDVWAGDELGDINAFGLTDGEQITAYGTFDDSVLDGSGNGTISFSAASGNTMTISVGTETFTAANDDDDSAYISILGFTTFDDFDFQALLGSNGAPADFNSSFTTFDDYDMMFGDWQTTIVVTAVPVPAAIWLFGSGLLGLAGIARRKTT